MIRIAGGIVLAITVMTVVGLAAQAILTALRHH